MGFTKRMIENQEAQNGEAIAIAIAGGALRRCDYHSEIVIDQHTDPTDAYKIANARFTSGELAVYRTRFPGHTFVLCRLA